MNSTQLRASSACMPPIINFTPSTPIKEMEVETPMYDYFRQISGYEMRTVSTKSIHRESTRKRVGLQVMSLLATPKMPLTTLNQ